MGVSTALAVNPLSTASCVASPRYWVHQISTLICPRRFEPWLCELRDRIGGRPQGLELKASRTERISRTASLARAAGSPSASVITNWEPASRFCARNDLDEDASGGTALGAHCGRTKVDQESAHDRQL
jgi:hypothetical protein